MDQRKKSSGGGGSGVLSFRSNCALPVATSPLTVKPAGLAVGDLLVAQTPFDPNITITTPGVTGGVWAKFLLNWAAGAYNLCVYWRIATADDLTQNWTLSATSTYPGQIVAYAGAGAAALVSLKEARTTLAASGTTLAFTGYTPSSPTAGALVFLADRDGSNHWTGNAPFTLRWDDAGVPAGVFNNGGFDALGSLYTGGGATFTSAAGTTGDQAGMLLEVT